MTETQTLRDLTKIAIIDLDGVIADTTVRFSVADGTGFPKRGDGADKYWAVAFDPQLVRQDEVIEGAKAALEMLRSEGWHIVILTSRPVNLYPDTLDWLNQHDLLRSRDDLILKPNACRWQKTVYWKADMVAVLTQTAHECLVVDDEDENLDTITNHRQLNWRIQNRGFKLKVCWSLSKAVVPATPEPEQETEPEDEPF